MFDADKLKRLFNEEKEARRSESSAAFNYLFGKGHQRFNAGMLSLLLTVALASHFYKPPAITEDRFVEAGESFTAPKRSIVSGEIDKDLFLGMGYPLYDNDPTSGEMYLAIDEPVALRARSKVYIRTLRQNEDPRTVVEKTMEWQAMTPTFCRNGCNSLNIRHNATILDMIPEQPYRNLRNRYKQ